MRYLTRPLLPFLAAPVLLAGMARLLVASAAPAPAQSAPVEIRVLADIPVGPMTTMWAWFGHDEPNHTTMPDGRKLLAELAELSPVPVFVRTHNLLTTGDGTAALKWGSTNAYIEDERGNPVYEWTVVDGIFDTYMRLGIKPLVEIGFMPEALSSRPDPYRHFWKPGDPYGDIYTGWAYPPDDYRRWEELVYQWVRHSVERYGREEVESWWWEVWNEPDIGYWQGMGSPQPPTPAQAAELEAAGKLETLLTPAPLTIIAGRAVLPFRLPRQGVSLLTLTWPDEGGSS